MSRGNWYWYWSWALAAIWASPCMAGEYIYAVAARDDAWLIERSEMRQLPSGGLEIHYLEIKNPPEKYGDKLIHYKNVTAVLDCKAMTYSFGAAILLTDEFSISSMLYAPNMKLGDPVTPTPGTPFETAVHSLCVPGGPTGWTHSDNDWRDIARSRLRFMEAAAPASGL